MVVSPQRIQSKMEVAKQLVSSVRAWRDNLGRAFVLITLIVCVYQIWRRWREKRAIRCNVRGKVVLITGASSGLGEGIINLQFYVLLVNQFP